MDPTFDDGGEFILVRESTAVASTQRCENVFSGLSWYNDLGQPSDKLK